MEYYSKELKGMAIRLPYPCTLNDASLNSNFHLASLLRSIRINANAIENDPPLATVAYNGHMEIVRLLLENGVDINAPGGPCAHIELRETALHSHEPIVKATT
ncbi:hypothetical protein VF21_04317 [Pseudogymnoascus sp. 05NY08]|nr:hypothetical protein VF21_04317 [Pseudogymnoascus sp. 05NY08]